MVADPRDWRPFLLWLKIINKVSIDNTAFNPYNEPVTLLVSSSSFSKNLFAHLLKEGIADESFISTTS